MGVSLTGPVNAQGAQWGCRYNPVDAQGDQLDYTVSGCKPGVQRDCVLCVRVYEGCGQTWLQVRSSTRYILNSIFDILYQMNRGMIYTTRPARDRVGRRPYRHTTNVRDWARNISTCTNREISEGAPPSAARIALK